MEKTHPLLSCFFSILLSFPSRHQEEEEEKKKRKKKKSFASSSPLFPLFPSSLSSISLHSFTFFFFTKFDEKIKKIVINFNEINLFIELCKFYESNFTDSHIYHELIPSCFCDFFLTFVVDV